MRKKLSIILLATFLTLCVFLLGFFCSIGKPRSNTDPALVIYGNVDVREVDLGFRVAGRVDSMQFEEGDIVTKGAHIASLEKRPYIDALQQAKAVVHMAECELKNAEQIYVRRYALLGTGAISEEEYSNALSDKEVAVAKLKTAQAQLATAETNIADTEIFAPIDSTVLTRIREPGTVVNVADPIYTLSILSPVWIRAYVSEPELGIIYPGMRAVIATDTKTNKTYTGYIGFISPVSEFTPKTVQTTDLRTDLVYRIRVVVDNADHFLKQGMPVTVQLLPESSHKK